MKEEHMNTWKWDEKFKMIKYILTHSIEGAQSLAKRRSVSVLIVDNCTLLYGFDEYKSR